MKPMKMTIRSTAIDVHGPGEGRPEPGAHDGELAEEQAEGRRPGDGDGARKPKRALRGKAAADAADMLDVLGAVGAHHVAGPEEHERLVQRVIEHVVERTGDAQGAAEAEAERDHAHMLDARVRHQPLDPALLHDEKGADQQRQDAERDQRQLGERTEVGLPG